MLSQIPLTFGQTQTQLMTNSRADWDGFHNYLRNVPWRDICKLGASAAAIEFCEQTRGRIDVYISQRKYQVNIHLHGFYWFLQLPQLVEINFLFVSTE